MKRVLLVLVIAAIAVGLFFAFSNQSAGGLAWEYKFKPGQVDKYNMTMDITMNMPGMSRGPMPSSISMNSTGTMTQKVLKVNPDGSAEIETTMGDMKMTMPGIPGMPAGQSMTMPGKTFKATISKFGKVIKGDEAAAMMPGGMDITGTGGQLGGIQLPGKAVKIGDSWSEEVKTELGVMKIDSKLAKEGEKIGNVSASRIDQTFKLKGDTAKDTGDKLAAAMGMLPKGEMDITGSGTTYFVPAEGRMIKSEVNAVANITTDTPGGLPLGGSSGSKSSLKMDMKMKVERI